MIIFFQYRHFFFYIFFDKTENHGSLQRLYGFDFCTEIRGFTVRIYSNQKLYKYKSKYVNGPRDGQILERYHFVLLSECSESGIRHEYL